MSLALRVQRGLREVRAVVASGPPFIADERYTSFHGITGASAWNNPIGRIEIASKAIWVYSCIEARKGATAFVPLKLYTKDEKGHKTEVRDHPIVELLEDINPVKDTPSSIRMATEQGLCIHGRYTIKKVRNRAGIVKELYGLPQQYVDVEKQGNWIGKFVYEYYDERKARVTEKYPVDDILYFRYGDYEDGVEGLSPLAVAVGTIQADMSIVTTQNAMSLNMARPSMIITVMNRLNDTDYAREDERIRKAYAGAVNAGKTMLVDNARDTKVTPVQLSPREMEWIAEHKSHITDICSAFKTTPGVVGEFAEASRLANAGTMHRIFGENFVRPELQLWEDVYNWQLLWTEDWGHGAGWEKEQGMFLEHDLTSIPMFREDDNAKSERAQIALASGATVNEVLQMQGLNPTEDDLGKKRFIPSNLALLDTAGEQPAGRPDYQREGPKKEHVINQAGDKITNPQDQEDMTYAKAIETKQYRKWLKKRHSGNFIFHHLNATEQRALISLESDEEPSRRVDNRQSEIFNAALAEFRSARNEPQSLTVPVTVNIPPATVNVTQPAVSVTNMIPEPHLTPIEVRNDIHVPTQDSPAPVIQVNVPKQDAPVVNNQINVPKQATPIVNNTINVPEQDAPVVNVQTPDVTVNNTVIPTVTLAENSIETDVVERDSHGRVARVVKISETKIETK